MEMDRNCGHKSSTPISSTPIKGLLKTKPAETGPVDLVKDLKTHIERFDFSIFRAIPYMVPVKRDAKLHPIIRTVRWQSSTPEHFTAVPFIKLCEERVVSSGYFWMA